MSRIDPVGAGLTAGLLLGGAHAAWIALVALTATDWVADVVLPGRVIRATFELDGVDLSVAAFLVVMTTLAGCAVGWMSATTWNGLAGPRAAVPQAGR